MYQDNAGVLLSCGSSCILTQEGRVVNRLADASADLACANPLLEINIKPPERELSGVSIVPVGRCCPDNYWHFTTGVHALLLLAIRHSLFSGREPVKRIIIPNFTRDVFVQMLNLCWFPGADELEVVLMNEGGHVCCEKVIAVGNAMGWEHLVPPWKQSLVRSVYLRNRSAVGVSPHKKVLIVRKNVGRGFADQDMVVKVCAAKGYIPVDLEGMTFLEQAALFNAATHIIAAHGSGLTNLFYAQKGARVLEIFNPFYVVDYFTTLAELNGLTHYTLVGDGPRPNARVSSRTNDPIVFKEEAFASAIRKFEN